MSEVKTPLEVAHERLAQYIAERDEQKRLLEISRAIEAEQCDEIARLKRVIVILNGQLDVTQKELAERDRELEAVKRDLADSSAQIVLDNDTVQALRSQLEATKERLLESNACLKLWYRTRTSEPLGEVIDRNNKFLEPITP